MTIGNLISNQINFCKNRCYSCNQLGDGELMISYHLTLPAWYDDSDILKSPMYSITYMGNRKKGIAPFTAGTKDLSEGYPLVTKNKRLNIHVNYNIKDWVNTPNFDINHFLSIERERLLREIKSNITLTKIGHLSKQWQDESDGKFHVKENFNYGASRYNNEVNNKYNGIQVVVPF